MARFRARSNGFPWGMIPILVTLLAFLPGARPAWGQTPEPDIAFGHVFRQLAAKFHAPIIVEGMPLRPAISEDEFLDLWIPNDRAETAIPAAAALFDYRVLRRGETYLLLKQFSNPLDLPEISVAEVETAMREILAILDHINPPVAKTLLEKDRISPRSYRARELLRSISEAQWRVFQSSPQGYIRFTDLRPEQRRLLEQMVFEGDVREIRRTAEGVLTWVERIPDVTLTRDKAGTSRETGYRVRYTEANGREIDHFSPLSKMGNRNRNPDTEASERIVGAANALTDLRRMPDPETITYRELAARLSGAGSSSTDPPFSADPLIADKAVTLFGEASLPAVELFRAAAALHGLRVQQPRTGFYTLTRPRPPMPARLETPLIAEAIRAALPDALARAVRLRETAGVLRTRGERPIPRPTGSDAEQEEYEAARIVPRADRMAVAAVALLRVFADRDLLPTPDSPPVPMTELPFPGDHLLAVYGLTNTDFVRSLLSLRTHRPLTVTRLPRTVVRCVQNAGGSSLTVRVVEADGSLYPLIGMSWSNP